MLRHLLRLNAAAAYLAFGLLWLLVFVVSLDVVLRFAGSPTLWAGEVSIYLMIAIAFLGAGYTYDQDGHFAINLAVGVLPDRVRLGVESVVVVLSLIFTVLLAIGAIRLMTFSAAMDFRSPTVLQVPLYLPQSMVLVGGVSLAISLVTRLTVLWQSLKSGEVVPVRREHSI